MKKVFRILLALLMVLSLAACTRKVSFFTDNEVDKYAKQKSPGCTFVSKTQAAPKNIDANVSDTTYIYEDSEGRQFTLTTVIHYAQDFGNSKVDWLYTKKIEQSYEMDVFDACKDELCEYLQSENVGYDIDKRDNVTTLVLYLDDTDEDSIMHLAEVCYCIDNYILKFNVVDEVTGYPEAVMRYFHLDIKYTQSDGTMNKIPRSELSLSTDPLNRRDIQYFYDAITNNIQ